MENSAAQTYREHGIRLSIVIPAYNDENTIERAAKSCLAQMESGLEVIIVDDCSTDATGTVANQLAEQEPGRIRVIHNGSNQQALKSRKIGFDTCWGEYAMFLDADDELSEGCCEAALSLEEESKADIVAFTILPCYEDDSRPDDDIVEGQKRLWAAPDAHLTGLNIAHASYRDAAQEDAICWSMCGKLYRREILRKAFGYTNTDVMFYGDDAYFYFVAASLAQTLVSSSEIPPYRYNMGCGDTFAGQRLDTARYGRLCRNVEAAKRVRSYLDLTGRFEDFADDYRALRFRLLQDPVNRYPREVMPEHRGTAFDELLAHWPAEEAIGVMAAVHWHEPEIISSAISDSASLAPRRSDAGTANPHGKTLTICIDSLTMPALEGHGLLLLLDQWRSMGLEPTVIADEDVELPAEIDASSIRLPKGLNSYGTAYLPRAAALRSALANADVFLCCERSHVVAWDLMVARSVGASCVVLACGTLTAICGNGGFPAELPLFCGLANAAVCSNDTEAELWKPFVGSTCIIPVLGDTAVCSDSFWTDVFSCTSTAPAMPQAHYALWKTLLNSMDALRGKYFEHVGLLAEMTRERDQLAAERDQLAAERDQLEEERARLTAERDELAAEIQALPRDTAIVRVARRAENSAGYQAGQSALQKIRDALGKS